jgi:hypothetical protein
MWELVEISEVQAKDQLNDGNSQHTDSDRQFDGTRFGLK